MAVSAARQVARLLLASSALSALLQSGAASSICGTSPKIIYVAKGDKKHIKFSNMDDVASWPAAALSEGVGEQPHQLTDTLQPAAALVAASSEENVQPPVGLAGTDTEAAQGLTQAPSVVPPTDSEAVVKLPLDGAQLHNLLPEAPTLEEEIADKVVPVTVHKGTVEDAENDELIKAEGSGIEAANESNWPIFMGSGENENAETSTENTIPGILDRIAVEDSMSELDKSAQPLDEADENQLYGSGDEVEHAASATIPLNKYHEIVIPFDSADDEMTGSEETTILQDEDIAEADDEDRLTMVADFSGDNVLLEWIPDTEGFGQVTAESNSEGSGVALSETESGAGSGVQSTEDLPVVQISSAVPIAYLSEAELSLNLLEQSQLELTTEARSGANTDELLPLVQSHGSIHDLLLSLPLHRPLVMQVSSDFNSDVNNDVTGDVDSDVSADGSGVNGENEARPEYSELEGTQADQSTLERLLLLQGFTTDDRVILEHISVPFDCSGSGQDIDDDKTQLSELAPMVAVAGSGGLPLYESSGKGDENSDSHEEEIENIWAEKEALVTANVSSSANLPNSADLQIDESETDVPAVKGSEKLAQVERIDSGMTERPIAKTEGVPLVTGDVKLSLRQDSVAEADDSDNDAQTTPVVESHAGLVKADDSVSAPELSVGSPEQPLAASTDTLRSVTTPNHQTLLSSIYRVAPSQEMPNRFSALRGRSSRAGFSGSRRIITTLEPFATNEAIIVGQDPYLEHYKRTGGRDRPKQRDPSREQADAALRYSSDIPAPMQKTEQETAAFDAAESLRKMDDQLFRFLRSQPYPFVSALMNDRGESRRSRVSSGLAVDCEWQLQTEPHLYLLVTLNNLSAPHTINCNGAYIAVEREMDGFEARWCGNWIKQSDSRRHMVFARGQVRIAVFNDGNTTELPTGFEAEVEVIDLLDSHQYTTFQRSAINLRRLIQHPLPQL